MGKRHKTEYNPGLCTLNPPSSWFAPSWSHWMEKRCPAVIFVDLFLPHSPLRTGQGIQPWHWPTEPRGRPLVEVAESPRHLPMVPGQARRHVHYIRDKVRGVPGVITPDLALAAAHCLREGDPKLSWTFPSSWVVVLGGLWW